VNIFKFRDLTKPLKRVGSSLEWVMALDNCVETLICSEDMFYLVLMDVGDSWIRVYIISLTLTINMSLVLYI
jgi:hypothetical protein